MTFIIIQTHFEAIYIYIRFMSLRTLRKTRWGPCRPTGGLQFSYLKLRPRFDSWSGAAAAWTACIGSQTMSSAGGFEGNLSALIWAFGSESPTLCFFKIVQSKCLCHQLQVLKKSADLCLNLSCSPESSQTQVSFCLFRNLCAFD